MEEMEYKFNTGGYLLHKGDFYETSRRVDREKEKENVPLLSDRSLIESFLNEFKNYLGRTKLTINQRQVFVFLIQTLYAHWSLSGGKMPSGLRKHIARVLHLHSQNVVSRASRLNSFHYKTYSQFRNDCDNAMNYIVTWLMRDGHAEFKNKQDAENFILCR